MKRLLMILAAALLLVPAVLSAQATTTKTYFEGERITGIDVSEHFVVTLVKSDRARVVVRTGKALEQFVSITRNGDGVVTVGVINQRELNRVRSRLSTGPREHRLLRLTFYLPTLSTIRLSEYASLTTSGEFSGENLDIMLADHAAIHGSMRIASETAKVQFSGHSRVENLILDQTTSLTVFGAGNGRANIAAPRAAYSKLNLSSGASLEISGAGEWGNWSAGGDSRIIADNFAVRILEIEGRGRSSSRVNAWRELTARLTGTASVRYRGEPRVINIYKLSRTTSVRPL